MRIRALLLILLPLFILTACRQTNEASDGIIEINVALDTENPSVGDATLLVTVTTSDGTAINDATVTVRGDMSHAGMVPVIPEPVSEAQNGVYSIPFEFTMGGDWIITVDVTLADGETASTEYTVNGVATSGTMDMDHSNMDMGTAVSGAYMSITNNGDTDATLLAVTAEGVGMVQIHETIVDENDMASMQEVEGGITIAAGETVALSPGGLHIMLMNIENDLIEGETITLTLEFLDGSTISLNAPIVSMAPMDAEPFEANNLSITGYWVRPTALAIDMEATAEMDMDNMDMEATEESE